ncbi:6,7-dimethyl-8-ribityllumazine synthase [Cerasicoccus fimbriatus]|uniref:6,7-dimethyl-8-ribityllumazine synthase n=1 Tax=Cerasicoccus fimbriatus TaxID=3014554 RepID=UPI0022B4A96D|nr:6,7-dimethyl-8-ribityllumazine synthase [Cerasicoccus sp. TK19100]
MSEHQAQFEDLDASDLYFSIIAARYNGELIDVLIQRAVDTLVEHGANPENIDINRVPGSNEIPYLAGMHGLTGQYDCIIGLGVIIKGGTAHDEVIAHSTANALHTAAMSAETPIINGIITANTEEQAVERIKGPMDRGAEFARAAIEMARHKLEVVETLDELEQAEFIEDFSIEDDDDDDDLKRLFRKN